MLLPCKGGGKAWLIACLLGARTRLYGERRGKSGLIDWGLLVVFVVIAVHVILHLLPAGEISCCGILGTQLHWVALVSTSPCDPLQAFFWGQMFAELAMFTVGQMFVDFS